MKKLFKRLSFLLALCLLLSVFPAHAAEIVHSGKGGENVTWTLDGDGLLTINGKGEITTIYLNKESVKRAVITNDITSIGERVFIGCKNLTSVSIPSTVTSIGESAFENCMGLTNVTIPNGVTNIGGRAFYGCSSLSSISIPNSVNSIGDCILTYCNKLNEITVYNNPFYYVKQNCLIRTADKTILSGCKNSEIPTDGSVKVIGKGAFMGLLDLRNINIPNGITTIENWAFYDCINLTSITLADSITSIGGGAFHGCENLEMVSIPNGVQEIEDGTFRFCYNLKKINIPDKIKTIGHEVFLGCKSLTEITLPKTLNSLGSKAFAGCTGLTNMMIPNSVTNIGWAAFDGCSNLTSVTIPDRVTDIQSLVFEDCSSLMSIIIPVSVTYIEFNSIPVHTVIYGEAGSYVQKWAEENNREFRLISELIELSAPETMTVKAGEETDIEIIADYAAGKTVSIAADNDNVTLPDSNVTLDADGKATITIIGKTAGETKLIFMLDGTDKTAETKVVVSEPEPSETLPGDVSGDGEVTAEDARLALRAAVGLETYEKGSAEFLAADASKNGAITSEDARLILRAAVGLEALS